MQSETKAGSGWKKAVTGKESSHDMTASGGAWCTFIGQALGKPFIPMSCPGESRCCIRSVRGSVLLGGVRVYSVYAAGGESVSRSKGNSGQSVDNSCAVPGSDRSVRGGGGRGAVAGRQDKDDAREVSRDRVIGGGPSQGWSS